MTRPPITHVAVRYNGVVYSAPRPARHHDLIRCICEATGADEVDATVNGGFIHPKTGSFMDRAQAAHYAKLCGQIDKLRYPPQLYSEELW